MLEQLFERLTGRNMARFKIYREARRTHESCLPEVGKGATDLNAEDFARWRNDERLKSAEAGYREAIAMCREENAARDLATVLNQLGMLLHLQGRLDEAEACVLASQRVQEGLPQTDHQARRLASHCQYYLGVISLQRGQMAAARKHLQVSADIDESLADFEGVQVCRRALARCDQSPGAPDEGLEIRTPAIPQEYLPVIRESTPTDVAGSGGARQGLRSNTESAGERAGGAHRSRRFSPGGDRVWLLSQTVGANDHVMELLEGYHAEFPRNIHISRAAFGSEDAEMSVLEPVPQGEQLCAAVLVVEPAGLMNESFRKWARQCIALVEQDDFRLFVTVHDMALEELRRMAARFREAGRPAGKTHSADALAEELLDTVQISEDPNGAQLGKSLASYLNDLDNIRDAARWRRLRLAATVMVGYAALALQIFCGLAVVAGALSWMVSAGFGWEPTRGILSRPNPNVLAVIFGVPVFVLQTIPIHLILHGLPQAHRTLRDHPDVKVWFIAGAVLCPAAVGLPEKLGASGSMIALGIAAGVMLDTFRRNGIQARRARISLRQVYDSISEPHASKNAWDEALNPRTPHPLTCPLFPMDSFATFISYHRCPVWGSVFAKELHAELTNRNVPAFLDRYGIEEGSGWCSVLTRNIAEAQTFLVLMDESSLDSKWMAAEILTALSGRQMSQHPEIIILAEPTLAATAQSKGLPIFGALLRAAANPTGATGIRLIRPNEMNVNTLAIQLATRQFKSESVMPMRVRILLWAPSLLLGCIGAVSTALGLPALFFGGLQVAGKADSAGWLAQRGMLEIAVLTAAYAAGFATRALFASRFQIDHKNPTAVMPVHRLATLGLWLLALGWAWAGHLPATVLWWAATLVIFGWLMAGNFFQEAAKARPELLRKAG